jgi:hypothetical protein
LAAIFVADRFDRIFERDRFNGVHIFMNIFKNFRNLAANWDSFNDSCALAKDSTTISRLRKLFKRENKLELN